MSPRVMVAFASIEYINARCGIWLGCCRYNALHGASAFFSRDLPAHAAWANHGTAAYQKPRELDLACFGMTIYLC